MKRQVPVGPGISPNGAVAITAGTAEAYSWYQGGMNPIGIENNTGGDINVSYAGTATVSSYDHKIQDSQPLTYIPGYHRISVYSAAGAIVSGVGQNLVIKGWP